MGLAHAVLGISSEFQSPSHRGGSAPLVRADEAGIRQRVSIPFSSGRERSQGMMLTALFSLASAFQSPSHRGGSAPFHSYGSSGRRHRVSIPFSSGRERSPLSTRMSANWLRTFQSPSHRGGSAPRKSSFRVSTTRLRFNPLLIGAGALPQPSLG